MKKFLQIPLTLGIATLIQLVSLSPSQAEIVAETNASQPKSQNSRVKEFAFNFNNVFDYSTCLDVIVLAYEQRNAELKNAIKNDCANNVLETFGNTLAKNEALELVESANTHATEGLENPLYPTLGVRRRIAINLGYVYEPDKNNPDILKYIEKSN